MMCAIRAGERGRSVVIIDHAKAAGDKIRISGGGRCNFTNIYASAKNYLSENPHFCKSALARFTPQDFISMVDAYGISWHEKTLGQLFCDHSAKDIINMLLREMQQANVRLDLSTGITDISKTADGFVISTSNGKIETRNLVIASGGKSIPKMGATGFAYQVAEQFGHTIIETRPGLVPLTLEPHLLEQVSPLSGVAVDAELRHGKTRFREALLFTHRGMSGPAILQISSYWREGDEVILTIEPEFDFLSLLKNARQMNGKQSVQTVLAEKMPRRLAQFFTEKSQLNKPLADISDKSLMKLIATIQDWHIKPAGSEGYRTAEVTLGGIDTKELDSKTMASQKVQGLYFIGECVDVTGWLGGYNFQWAWASGHSAGQAL